MKLIQIKLVLLSLCLFGTSSLLFCQPNEKNTAQPTPNITKSLSEITPEKFEMLAEEKKELDEAIKALSEEERIKVGIQNLIKELIKELEIPILFFKRE